MTGTKLVIITELRSRNEMRWCWYIGKKIY